MEDKDEFADIFSFLEAMYDSNRTAEERPGVGQFVWVPVPERDGKPWVADVVRSAPTSHDSAELTIRRYDSQQDFQGKGSRLPIHALNLTDNHELMISRAKKRLCLIVGQTEGADPYSLPEGPQRNKALNAFHRHYILAPLYSVSSPAKATSFGSVMSARIRCLMYPEFFWLPKTPSIIRENSVARLDHLLTDPLIHGVSPENHFISDEARGFIADQLRILCGDEPSTEYLELQEVLLDDLPDVFK
ncbi:hypothetical protein [Tamilnaduibacter salinus]|uniref:hypothetical protein n=1 Tax=Tamilnaduibacter salinus TaxID=1484056 RepID=UPI00117ECA27|nr:hypothetical protein [Tamilnaduibacter salinus]